MAPHVVLQSDLCLPLRHRSPPLPVAPRTGPAHRLRLLSLPYRRLAVRVSSSGSKNRGAEQQRSGLQTGFQRDSDGERLTIEVEKEEAEGRGGSGERHEGPEWNWPPWKHLPERYKLIGTTGQKGWWRSGAARTRSPRLRQLLPTLERSDAWDEITTAVCWKAALITAADQHGGCASAAARCRGWRAAMRGKNRYCGLLEGSVNRYSRSEGDVRRLR
ncbi:hypothetical protein BHM03_00034207 [Ensete ventricosum]|nr:hypothetical protein BHM03_00034207 [Ensete ventricosum]